MKEALLYIVVGVAAVAAILTFVYCTWWLITWILWELFVEGYTRELIINMAADSVDFMGK